MFRAREGCGQDPFWGGQFTGEETAILGTGTPPPSSFWLRSQSPGHAYTPRPDFPVPGNFRQEEEELICPLLSQFLEKTASELGKQMLSLRSRPWAWATNH